MGQPLARPLRFIAFALAVGRELGAYLSLKFDDGVGPFQLITDDREQS
ncbi:MAG: hypothetical protein ABI671_00065 [Burkholderiales bacterium]